MRLIKNDKMVFTDPQYKSGVRFIALINEDTNALTPYKWQILVEGLVDAKEPVPNAIVLCTSEFYYESLEDALSELKKEWLKLGAENPDNMMWFNTFSADEVYQHLYGPSWKSRLEAE